MFRILFLLLLLFMTAVSAGGYWLYKHYLTAPFPLYTNLRYTVEPNTTLSQVAKDFMEKRLLNYPGALAWVTLARWQKRAHKIKAGEYLIRVGMTPQQFLDVMIMGKTTQHSLMLLEGWNFRQVMNHVHNHPEIVKKLDETKDFSAIMAQLGQPNQHPEGRFYPDTYYFPTGTSDIELLQRAYQMMVSELEAAWDKRDKEIPLKTPDEALILASIIEKETGVANERPIIAGVFVRRLKKKHVFTN